MEGSSSMVVNEENEVMDLPPGFRFHPTDEEIITHYLTKKVMDERLTTVAIGEVDMNKCEPWDLPKKAKMWGKEWFFFSQKDRKYPTGMRTNRATNTGYWKATGKDREIYKGKGCLIGMKKTLVFYKGRAPKGDKSNWVMHEYRLEGKMSYYNFPRGAKDEWVVCKIFHKNSSAIKRNQYADHLARNDSIVQILDTPTLPPLVEDIPNNHMPSSSTFTHEKEEFKGTSSSSAKSTQQLFSSYFTNNNSNLQFQEHQRNNIFMPNYYTNASYQSSNNNPIDQNPIFFDYQPPTTECPDPSVVAANQHCKMEQYSSNNSMVSQSQDTEISSNRAFEIEDLEGISVRHDMQYLDNLWDY